MAMAQMCGDGSGVSACPSWRKISLLEADNASLRRQVEVLTAEVSLVFECLGKNLGLFVVNTDSFYFNMLHGEGSTDEVDNIKRSLALALPKMKPNEGDYWKVVANEEPPSQAVPVYSENQERVDSVELPILGSEGNVGKHFREEDYDFAPGEKDNQDNLNSKLVAEDLATETHSGPDDPGSLEIDALPVSVSRMRSKSIMKKLTSLRSTDKITDSKGSTRGPFKCQHCDASFTWRSQKKRHEQIHTGDRPFKCQYCSKSFKRAAHKKEHERIHTGEKPHKCKFCGETFARRDSRYLHELIHTGEKPYNCEFCDKSFRRRSYLSSHLHYMHTKERPYACQLCEKTFTGLSDLRSHEKVHRPKKQ